MPELPEVEVLVRHLQPLLRDRRILDVEIRRAKVLAPTSPGKLRRTLKGAKFENVARRGKYLLFAVRQNRHAQPPVMVLGHLGMTGRMYLLPSRSELPKHAVVVLELGGEKLIFEDTRYFGRFTLDTTAVGNLGPEPLGDDFTVDAFSRSLKRSTQPIKVKLLDQSLVAGVGNIYASEALFRAGISPRLPAKHLAGFQVSALWRAIREVLTEAIECGSTVPLNFAGQGANDGLFYYGSLPGAEDYYEERLRVYDRAGHPCWTCGATIQRLIQASRSTYFCPNCQPRGKRKPGSRSRIS